MGPRICIQSYADGDTEELTPRESRRAIVAYENFKDKDIAMPDPCKCVDMKYGKDAGGSKIEVRPIDLTPRGAAGGAASK